MAIRKKAPKGITQAEWNKVRTIYALIDNEIIMRDPMMASYTDASSYSKNKAKGVKEFIKFYHSLHPSIFGRSGAGTRLEKYISSQKGRVEIKAQLEKYQDEGLIDLPDLRFSVQQQEASLQDLDLSGGIFKSLEGKEKDMFSKAGESIEGSLYPLILNQTSNTANLYENLLAVDSTTDPDHPRVEFETAADAINSNNEMAGPARVMIAQFIKDIKFQATSLASEITNARYRTTGEPSERTIRKAQAIANKARAVLKSLIETGVSKSSDEVTGDSTACSKWLANSASVGMSGTADLGAIDAALIAGSSASDIDTLVAAMEAASALVQCKIGSESKPWSQAREKLIAKQNMSLFELKKKVSERSIYDRQNIATLLRETYQTARSMLQSGGISDKQYKLAERQLGDIRKQADSLPTIDQLIETLQDGDLSRVRDANYKSMIVTQKLKHLKEELSNASVTAEKMKAYKDSGWTAEKVVDALTKLYNAVSECLSVKPEDLKDAPFSSAFTATQLSAAKTAARTVQTALTKVKRSGLENALHTYITMQMQISTKNAAGVDVKKPFGINLHNAWKIASLQTNESMTKVVDNQTNGLIEARASATDRVIKYYMASTPYMLNQFFSPMPPEAQKKVNAATALLSNEKVKKFFGSDSLPRFTEFDKDPRKVLAKLPTRVKNMSRQQAAAMAKAIQTFMNQLFSRFSTVVTTQEELMAGGANYQETMKTLERQVELLEESLKGAKFDKGNRLNELPSRDAGIHFVGFIPKSTDGSMKARVAITCPNDLLVHGIFKGETFVSAGNRGGKFERQGYAASRTFAMTQEINGVDRLMRRPITDAMGNTVLIDWSPMDAQDLRNKYFISLYPYDLRNQELNRLYQAELSDKKQTFITSSDVMTDFGLT